MIGELRAPKPLVDLAMLIEAEFGPTVMITDFALLDPVGDFGISFVPLDPGAASLEAMYSVGVFSLFFEYVTEERDLALDPNALEWIAGRIRSVARNGVVRRKVPWARGLLTKSVTFLGEDPGVGEIVDQWKSW